jgi:hypothetical protein
MFALSIVLLAMACGSGSIPYRIIQKLQEMPTPL